MAQVAKGQKQYYKPGMLKSSVAEDVENMGLNDMAHMVEILKRTKKSLQHNYDQGSEAVQFLTESARNELVRETLETAKDILKKIRHEKIQAGSLNELQKTYKCMIEQANLMTEQFREKKKQDIADMSDAELNAEIAQAKDEKVN